MSEDASGVRAVRVIEFSAASKQAATTHACARSRSGTRTAGGPRRRRVTTTTTRCRRRTGGCARRAAATAARGGLEVLVLRVLRVDARVALGGLAVEVGDDRPGA